MAKWLTRWSAKPVFAGSIPARCSKIRKPGISKSTTFIEERSSFRWEFRSVGDLHSADPDVAAHVRQSLEERKSEEKQSYNSNTAADCQKCLHNVSLAIIIRRHSRLRNNSGSLAGRIADPH